MEFGPSGIAAGEASPHCVQARAALDGGGGKDESADSELQFAEGGRAQRTQLPHSLYYCPLHRYK